jgi:hypothetical protein
MAGRIWLRAKNLSGHFDYWHAMFLIVIQNEKHSNMQSFSLIRDYKLLNFTGDISQKANILQL